ncbi:MAG: hydantoinase/oxoprolinase family protein, partial [Phycisphaerae bacterium]
GKMKLDGNAAERAIETHIARPMGLSVEAAAAGMYRIINTNMSQGVREITVKRGLDPREFPLVAAGGAGPLHACMICHELEIPMFIVPRESSIFCAAGMLMCDLQHDFVCSFISLLGRIDWPRLRNRVEEMNREGDRMLANENLPPDRRRFSLKLDCRYHKQYHEVSFPITMKVIRDRDEAAIASAFHAEHKRMYGYSLEPEGSPIELINVRLRAIGQTEKPALLEEPNAGPDTRSALKGERRMFIPENDAFGLVGVYDGHKTHHGNHIAGPALIEQVNTSLFVSSTCDCVCDKCGSFVVYQKNRKPAFSETLQEALP